MFIRSFLNARKNIVEYDPQADALYIQFREGEVEETLEVGKNIFVDVDKEGAPLGIEILFVSRQLAPEDWMTVTVSIGKVAENAGIG